MKRVLVALMATSLLAVTGLSAHADTVTPTKGTHHFHTVDAFVDVLDGPTGTHHATIDTRLYVPDNATSAHPQPAILQTNGFGLDKTANEITSTASFLASHGYVVLTYTAQGFGKSSGCVTLQSRTFDVKDAEQLITKVLQSKPYVKKDAKGALVGVVGGSYGGGIDLNLAESDPRIRVINPGRTWSSLQYSLDPNNYVAPGDPTGFSHLLNQQGVFKLEWTSVFFASGTANPLGGLPPNGQEAGSCPQEHVENGEVADAACPGFNLPVCQTYVGIAATGDSTEADRALLADSSGTTDIGKLRVPTLLMQGQSDTLFNENDATATFLQLKRQGTPVKMIWNAGGHGQYNSKRGECDVYDGATTKGLDDCYLTLRTLAFFDHVFRGTPDSSPLFSYYRDWVPNAASGPNTQYGGSSAFPVPGSTTYTLSGSNALVTHGAVAGSATIVNPPGGEPAAYTETSEFTGPDGTPSLSAIPVTEIPTQHADFTTPAFPQDVITVGSPTLTVKLSHVAPADLVVFGKVYDIAPDGTATLIHRLIAPARIPTAALSKPVTIKLLGIAHEFLKGHALRVTLAATDQTSYNNKVPDVITVTTGPGSTLTVPSFSDHPVLCGCPPVVVPTHELPHTGLPAAPVAAGFGVLVLVAVSSRRVRRSTHN